MLNHWYKQKKQNDCYLGKLVATVVVVVVATAVVVVVVVFVIAAVVVFVAEQSQTFVRQTNNGQCC